MTTINTTLESRPQAHRHTSLWPTLLALAFGAFIIGTSEFLIMGILPAVAQGVGVSIGMAGQLVTAFAVGIALGAPTLTAATARIDRRTVLVGALLVFLASNLIVAVTTDYTILVIARFIGGAMAGLYYGVGIGSAAQLAPEVQRGRAISTVFGGITLATVLGSPIGIWIGQFMGWQIPFAGIAVLAVIASIVIRSVMPVTAPQTQGGFAALKTILGLKPVLLVLAATVLVNTGWFAGYTYIVPYLTIETGIAMSWVPAVLIGYGVLSALGNMLGGYLADQSLKRTLVTSISIMAATLAALAMLANSLPTVLVLLMIWAVAGWTFVTAIQTRIVEAAGSSADLASAFNISAFNTGIAAGAAAGGIVVQLSGITVTMAFGAVITILALVPLMMSYSKES